MVDGWQVPSSGWLDRTVSSNGWCLAYTHVIATFSEFLEGMNNNRTDGIVWYHPENIETRRMLEYLRTM